MLTEKFQEFLRFFEYFDLTFKNTYLKSVNLQKLSAFGFQFCLLGKSSKLPLIFQGFRSIRSVKRIPITNGKKALFSVT
jgi:hypothetical protein